MFPEYYGDFMCFLFCFDFPPYFLWCVGAVRKPQSFHSFSRLTSSDCSYFSDSKPEYEKRNDPPASAATGAVFLAMKADFAHLARLPAAHQQVHGTNRPRSMDLTIKQALA
jgi:hypothetical protein